MLLCLVATVATFCYAEEPVYHSISVRKLRLHPLLLIFLSGKQASLDLLFSHCPIPGKSLGHSVP